MNVIIANRKKELLDTLDIEVIKSLDGEYEVEELIGMFTNFFFNKMILDLSAIKNYNDITKLQKFSKAIDMSKVILFIGDSSFESSKEFISDIISLGIYNFTSSFNEIMELFNNPNTYEDVKKFHFDTSFRSGQVDDEEQKEVVDFDPVEEFDENLRIIGVQNLTDGAGATTLTVQMVKQLNLNYKAIGIEMNKQDFIFFTIPNLYSCTSRADAVKKINEHKDCEVVIVDLNTFNEENFCTDIIYLIEPSTIKFTKLIKRNKVIFDKIRGSKIVLNKTNLKQDDVKDFEVEVGTKVFKCVNSFNDRTERVKTVDDLLVSLGFSKQVVSNKSEVTKKRFSFFKKN